MDENAFWDRLDEKIEVVGVHLSYRFGGWYINCEAGSFGPYANREDAIAGIMSELIEQLHKVYVTIEERPHLLRKYLPDSDPEQN